MTKDPYQILLEKDELRPSEVGRILLYDMIDRRRSDKAIKRRITDEEIKYLVQSIKEQCSANDLEFFKYYNEAHNMLINMPGLQDQYWYKAFWSLSDMTRNAREVLTADAQYDMEMELPKVVTKVQYRDLKRQSVLFRRRKVKAKWVFWAILQYALANHDRKTMLPFTISKDEINNNPPKGWTGRQPLFAMAVEGSDSHFYPPDGKRLTPFEALSDIRFYSTSSHVSTSIREDFPQLIDQILDLMQDAGVKFNPFLEEEHPHVSYGTLLEGPLSFLYGQHDPLPLGTAVIQTLPYATTRFIDEHGHYVPPTPRWRENCFDVCGDEMVKDQEYLIKQLADGLRHAYAFVAFSEVAEVAMDVKGIQDIFRKPGGEIDLLDKYHETRDVLQRLYQSRIMFGRMEPDQYHKAMKAFPRLNINKLKPPKEKIKNMCKNVGRTLFMGQAITTINKLTEPLQDITYQDNIQLELFQ